MQYAPAKIKNPVSEQHVVRLLPMQKLILFLTRPELVKAEVYLKSDFLILEQDVPGRFLTFKQKSDVTQIWGEGTFFLGEIIILGTICSSICLFLESKESNRIQAINPNGQLCKIEPHQVLEVVYIIDWATTLDCSVIQHNRVSLEQIDYKIAIVSHRTRNLLIEGGAKLGFRVEEHRFSFRYDASSIEWVNSVPYGRYPGGTLLFYEKDSQEEPFSAAVNVLLNWREQKKTDLYKALLIPRNNTQQYKQQKTKIKPKQAMIHKVSILPKPVHDMETGCNVIVSRC